MSSWQKWPDADVPNFQSNVSSIYQCLMDLGARVLSIMAIGLKMVSCLLFLTSTFMHFLNWECFKALFKSNNQKVHIIITTVEPHFIRSPMGHGNLAGLWNKQCRIKFLDWSKLSDPYRYITIALPSNSYLKVTVVIYQLLFFGCRIEGRNYFNNLNFNEFNI